jgi:glycosyltransferase involved in cell wall biosynthesis
MKPIVMVFTGRYLPGYKAGGILRNLVNTVENLYEYCDFRIVTRDRDLGDETAYADVPVGQWTRIGSADVMYLGNSGTTLRNLYRLLKDTMHDVVYLTSYFDPLTIKVLFIRLFMCPRFRPVVVAPFGEFAWASFKQKVAKKILFVCLARVTGLYRRVIWRVSSQYEAEDLRRMMSPPATAIKVTGDLPIRVNRTFDEEYYSACVLGDAAELRVIFLSRVSREKNLNVAILILSKVHARVVFDIYGPIENRQYWLECQKIIDGLPKNVIARYCGLVQPNQIIDTFSRYDMFLFPTGGEAYGNVIAESLMAGTLVLTSQNTPWRNLHDSGLGWDLDICNIDAFVKIIDDEALKTRELRISQKKQVRNAVRGRLFDPEVLASNLRLFGIGEQGTA